ncbi:MAG TPA: hypothetical protein DDZ76_07415 [Xanthomonadales bacterium]|nr:hypothetical protein [Xanthomonadales bacterium]
MDATDKVESVLAKLASGFASDSITQRESITPLQLKSMLAATGAASIGLKLAADQDSSGLLAMSGFIRKLSMQLPAAGVAMCMHQHVVLACARHAALFPSATTTMLIDRVRTHDALVSSAFAEGIPGSDIFRPSVSLQTGLDRATVNGHKQPCTLSSIADYHVVSGANAAGELQLAMIPSKTPGVSSEPFFRIVPLAACDSNRLVLRNVEIENDLVSTLSGQALTPALSYGMCVFSMFIASAYSGVVDALIERIPPRVSSDQAVRNEITGFHLTTATLVGLMVELCFSADQDEASVAQVLSLRYEVEQVIDRTLRFLFVRLGGIAVMSNPDLLLLHNIAQLMKYHPVSRHQFLIDASSRGV